MDGTPTKNLKSANHDSNPGQFRQLPASRIRRQKFALDFTFVGAGKIMEHPNLGRFSSEFHQCTAALMARNDRPVWQDLNGFI
jgi:hypothetical protein